MIKVCKFLVWLLGCILWAIFFNVIINVLIQHFPSGKLVLGIINIACAFLYGAVSAEYIMNFDYEWWKYKREMRKSK